MMTLAPVTTIMWTAGATISGLFRCPPAETYFAKRLGDWLVIGIDSQLIGRALEREYAWLDAVLRRPEVGCTLALWHMPAFSGLQHGPTPKMQRFWRCWTTAMPNSCRTATNTFTRPSTH
jgi:hypothetical protein